MSNHSGILKRANHLHPAPVFYRPDPFLLRNQQCQSTEHCL